MSDYNECAACGDVTLNRRLCDWCVEHEFYGQADPHVD